MTTRHQSLRLHHVLLLTVLCLTGVGCAGEASTTTPDPVTDADAPPSDALEAAGDAVEEVGDPLPTCDATRRPIVFAHG